MAQATWTEATGSNWHSRTAHGACGRATAEFAIEVAAAHNDEIRKERGRLRVKVGTRRGCRASTGRGRAAVRYGSTP